MNVVIETSPLRNGDRVRGTGSYTRSLIEALQKYEKQHSFYFFTRGEKIPDIVDLVHYPYFTPFFLTLPIVSHKPYVVTVHDLIPIAYPDNFPKGGRGEIKWQFQKRALRRAARIITDSLASKADISRFAAIPKGEIDVVRLAPGDVFRRETDQDKIQSVRRGYNLVKNYLLYVGDVNWNKNIEGLLRAFAIVRENQKGKTLQLCLVGDAFTKITLPETRKILESIQHLGISDSVRMTGFVKDDDLRALYTDAALYIQPSFAEGFGLPVLEAMACGCPVVCSTASALSEVAGPAVQVDPKLPESIADGILSVLMLHAHERNNLSRKGREWTKRFTWERVASETTAAYEKAYS